MKPRAPTPPPNGAPRLRPAPPPAPICFRLDPTSRQALERQAAQLGVSPHSLARHAVLEQVNGNQERTALWEALKQLDTRLCRLREELVLMTEGILVGTGAMTKAQARAWSEKCFP